MRFSFGKNDPPFGKKDTGPRWVDTPAFAWLPDESVRLAPAGRKRPKAERREPVLKIVPHAAPEPDPVPLMAVAAAAPVPEEPRDEAMPEPIAAPDAPPVTAALAVTAAPPKPANSDAPFTFATTALRLIIGLIQGLALFALLRARDIGVLTGPYTFSALSLALLFAPLLVLEGMDTIPPRLLTGWTCVATAILLGLGVYQRWRIDVPAPAHAGISLAVLVALFLFIGQCLLHGSGRAGKLRAPYAVYARESWSLAIRIAIWIIVTGLVWALGGGIGGLPAVWHVSVPPALVNLTLTGLASATILSLVTPSLLRAPRDGIVSLFGRVLPLAVAAAALAIAARMLGRAVPLSMLLAAGFALLLTFNAAYDTGEDRASSASFSWRKACQAAAALLLPILAAIATAALLARVTQHGWTAPRLFAGVAILFLAAWGIAYLASLLIAVGGGGWLAGIAPANLVLGVAAMAMLLALASPLADPMRLAARAQVARLDTGMVDASAFDFTSLKRDDARFGYEALVALTRSPSADIARGATLGLIASSEPLSATEVGANIRVLTPGARLPAALLSGDWSAQHSAAVPPCLTSPALACDAWFLDLDGDGHDEILLAYGDDLHWWATAMKLGADGHWRPAGTLAAPSCKGALAALREGRFTTSPALPGWRDIVAGGARLSLRPAATRPVCS